MEESIFKKEYHGNVILLEGTIEEEPKFHHKTFDTNIWSMIVRVPRVKKETCDYIPVEIEEDNVDLNTMKKDVTVRVEGQFRSFNQKIDGERFHLVLSVFAKEITPIESTEGVNKAHLEGYLCRPCNYRKTPLGKEICDIMLATPRAYKRSDYIPIIMWGRAARAASRLSTGSEIHVDGRVQSRQYFKTLPDGSTEQRMAYEISVYNFDFIGVRDMTSPDKHLIPKEEVLAKEKVEIEARKAALDAARANASETAADSEVSDKEEESE
jgi:single-stranded DNA-binding protein